MIIYEVTCCVTRTLYPDYLAWLRDHVAEMLTLDGFLSAEICQVDETEVAATPTLVIWYRVENAAALADYFAGAAVAMRAAGTQRFAEGVAISRRVLQVVG